MQPESEQKRLYRSRQERVLAGICGGIAEYVNFDPVVIRLLWIIATALTGIIPGIIAYIIAIFVIPERPREEASSTQKAETAEATTEKTQ